jgi:hypothetical protein
MIENIRVLYFALCALAIWPAAHQLARENGPWNLIVRLRVSLGSGILGRLMDNFYCLSFLLSLPPAIWMSRSLMGFFIQWLALSAATCLLGRATQGPYKYIRVSPVSSSYLDKVIRGV